MTTGTTTLRGRLLRGMLPVILLLGCAVFVIALIGARTAVTSLSRQVIAGTMAQAESRLRQFFAPAVHGLAFMRGLGEAGLLPIEDPDAMNAVLAPVLERHPQISSLLVADARGREHMLLKVGDRWRNRQTRVDLWGERSLWLEWSTGEAPYQEWRVNHYDPRQRPWYTGAQQAPGTVHWTAPYEFFTTKDPGITASATYDAGDGMSRVIGFDLMLRDITRFTQTLRAAGSGMVVVTTQDGRMLGLPGLARFERKGARLAALLRTPDEIGEPLLLDAAAALSGAGSQPVRFDTGGETWIGAARAFHPGSGLALRILVLVPQGDLVGDFATLRWWILGLTFLAMAVAAWRTAFEAGQVSRPIRDIVRQTERISQGDLSRAEPVRTPIEEVHRLAESQEQMRESLNTLMKLEQDLQLARRIQRDTFPREVPALEGYQLDAWSEPAEATGGDTYDLVATRRGGDGHVLVVEDDADGATLLLADAVGHGVGPALAVTQVRAMLRMAVRTAAPLDATLRHLNEQLCQDLTDGRFITVWLAELDVRAHALRSFSAGQGPLFHYVAAERQVRKMDADVPPLGVLPDLGMELSPPILLAPGDIFAVISDGILEAVGAGGEMFGSARVGELLRRHHDEPPSRILATLRDAVEAFTGARVPDDDRTAVVLKRV